VESNGCCVDLFSIARGNAFRLIWRSRWSTAGRSFHSTVPYWPDTPTSETAMP